MDGLLVVGEGIILFVILETEKQIRIHLTNNG
jgi:hypothetical protein